jgi:hypothetical protein
MSHWDDWLAFLRKLPADAPEWSGADAFSADFGAILDARRAQMARRQRLDDALARLKRQAGAQLDWWGFTDAAGWKALPAAAAQSGIEEKVDGFQEALITHAKILSVVPKNARDFEILREGERRSTETIRKLHAELAVFLSPSPDAGQDTAPGAAVVAAPTPVITPPPPAEPVRTLRIDELPQSTPKLAPAQPKSTTPTVSKAEPPRPPVPATPLDAASKSGPIRQPASASPPSAVAKPAPALPPAPATPPMSVSKSAPLRPTASAAAPNTAAKSETARPPTPGTATQSAPAPAAPTVNKTNPATVGAQKQEASRTVSRPNSGARRDPAVTPEPRLARPVATPTPPPPAGQPQIQVLRTAVEPPATRTPESADSPRRVETEPEETETSHADDRVPGTDMLTLRAMLLDLPQPDSPTRWSAALWPLLATGDIAAAYWLQRWVGGGSGAATSPFAKLLLALAGSEYMTRADSQIATDLLQLTSEVQLNPEAAHEELIALAAALLPAALAPISGMASWLRVPARFPEIRPLVAALQTFAGLEITVNPADILAIKYEERRKNERRVLIEDVQRWMIEAPIRHTALKRANVVWVHLTRQGGELSDLLGLVGRDDRQRDEEAGDTVARWRSTAIVEQRIRQIDEDKAGTNKRPIEAAALNYLRKNISEACGMVERWRALNKIERDIENRPTWLIDRVKAVREAIDAATPGAEARLADLMRKSEPPMAASAAVLRRAIGRLRQLFLLSDGTDAPKAGTVPEAGESLNDVICRRLLYWPEVDLTDSGEPTPAGLARLPDALRAEAASDAPKVRAQRLWLAREDYRFVDNAVWSAESGGPGIESQERDAARARSHFKLKALVERCLAEIEQAVVDGLINQSDERSQYAEEVAKIDVDRTQNHGAATLRLTERVLEQLRTRRVTRMSDLRASWAKVVERLPLSAIPPAKQVRLTAAVDATFAHGGIRAIEELLSQVREALDRKSDLDDGFFTSSDSIENEFIQSRNAYYAKVRDFEQNASIVSAQLEAAEIFLPAPRVDEARRAVDAWRRLKERGRSLSEDMLKAHMRSILRFLGLVEEIDDRQPVKIGTPLAETSDGLVHLRATVRVGPTESRFFPQFGSQARGKYEILCVWDRPSASQLDQYLKGLRLETQSVVVVYFARMGLARRHRISLQAKSGDLAVVVLDETLFAYLLSESRPRWQIFLRCSAPFAAINPYTPYRAGDVPPEMFFGREEEMRSLLSESGSCLVYGGRQLGKSALLRRTESQFSNPALSHHAWVVDIKRYGDLSRPADQIWVEIVGVLAAAKLKGQRPPEPVTPEGAKSYIRSLFLANTDLRVLIMLDESDNFIEADSRQGFANIEIFRQLMSDTQRRFKIVLAGLKTVQRFQSLPNQPLAHFGRPICIGPLAPRAAQALVRQPLEALGYYFANDAVILTILSYTNYHAGLVQLFCDELLRGMLQRNTDERMPPYPIIAADVESVYRSTGTRDRIVERFDWTLALDERYQAIAWSIVVDQAGAADSSARAYDPSEIRRLAESYWPAGFESMDADAFRGILSEMEGLGVLARSNASYRLRSPNVARLMEHVDDRLQELMNKKPSPAFTADSYHTPLDSNYRRYSPFTFDQERVLGIADGGLGLVFAAPIHGLETLPMAIERVIPPGSITQQTKLIRLGPEQNEILCVGDEALAWLRIQRTRHAEFARRIHVLEPGAISPDQLLDLARKAKAFCAESASDRVLVVLTPGAAFSWAKLPAEDRLTLSETLISGIVPRRWDGRGIRQRLAQLEKPNTDAMCEAVMAATGGWHALVERLFGMPQLKQDDGAEDAAKALAARMGEPASADRQAALEGLNLDPVSVAWRVLLAVHRYGGLSGSDLADAVEDEPRLGADEALAAREVLVLFGYLTVGPQGRLSVDPTIAQCLA